MKVGNEGKQLFKEWEGLKTEVYLDSGGEPTIGIGHLITREERLSGKIRIGSSFVDYRNDWQPSNNENNENYKNNNNQCIK